MPWYYRLISLFILFLFMGCADNQPTIGKKSFADEDNYIVKGIFFIDKNLSKSINIFDNLYLKTDKYVYLEEMIKLSFDNKDYNKTIFLVDDFIKKYPNKKLKVIDYKIYSYIKMKNYQDALKVAKSILKVERDLKVYKIVAYIYIEMKKYEQSIKYLKSAYAISHSPEVLAQMGDIFFKYLKNPNEAISYYQTHIRLYGCESLICNRLAQVYKFLYDYDNLISIYKMLYNSNGNIEYANKIVYLYLENGEYEKALNFIDKYRLGDSFKYRVYQTRFEATKDYQDAYKLYKLSGKMDYFFLYSVYKFNKSPKGLVNLRNLIANLEYLIKKDRNPLYLNYLGYLLIDYDIAPKKGLKLVSEALKEKPDSVEFLDSLAWGYYKLKKCKKAYQIISKIELNDKEIKQHKKLIRRCYDTTKDNKKDCRKSKKR